MAIDYVEKHKSPRQEGKSCRGVGRRGWESLGVRGGCRRCGSRGFGWWKGAGSLHRRSDGSHVPWLLFQPVDEGFHLGVDDLLCASETDADDYERHVGDTKVAFGSFP